jgi:alkylated DNA repair protein (DNA oxidative demethylase)
LGVLLSCLEPTESIGERAVVLRGFARRQQRALVAAVEEITACAPFRNMITPGGFRMSVAMTNCGRAGWVTDRRGYRYDLVDPMTGRTWPPMPASFRSLAVEAA